MNAAIRSPSCRCSRVGQTQDRERNPRLGQCLSACDRIVIARDAQPGIRATDKSQNKRRNQRQDPQDQDEGDAAFVRAGGTPLNETSDQSALPIACGRAIRQS